MLAAWKEAGVEPPAEFLEPKYDLGPELSYLDLQYLMAYQEAASCRQIGGMGGIGPIPFTAIDSVAQRFGFSNSEFLSLVWVIRNVDIEVLKLYSKEK